MSYNIEERTLESKPALLVRRTIDRSRIAATIGEALGMIMTFVQRNGLQVTGAPFARYQEMQGATFTMDTGMPVAPLPPGMQEEGEVQIGVLQAGPAATVLHTGPYDKLAEAYAALQLWMKEQGVDPAGPPWEEYLTDPEVEKDPAKWQTYVYWPIAR